MRSLSKKEWIAVSVSIVFIAYMFMGDTLASLFNESIGNTTTENQMSAVTASDGPQVRIEDIVVGGGAEVTAGMQVSVNYVLKLPDGTVIQDSKEVNSGTPFTFISGAGQLIPGWEIGILGMRAGGKRMIVIPPELGYGAQQVGPIPPNSTLIFEIEVVSVSSST